VQPALYLPFFVIIGRSLLVVVIGVIVAMVVVVVMVVQPKRYPALFQVDVIVRAPVTALTLRSTNMVAVTAVSFLATGSTRRNRTWKWWMVVAVLSHRQLKSRQHEKRRRRAAQNQLARPLFFLRRLHTVIGGGTRSGQGNLKNN
jgi:hypothetical protein